MSSVRRVSLVRNDPTTGASRTVLYERKRSKRKKQSTGLKAIERSVRQAARAEDAYASEYLARHEASNRKKRDGWLRDLDKNVYKASRKAGKKLNLRKLAGL
jgi:hypothetical protein